MAFLMQNGWPSLHLEAMEERLMLSGAFGYAQQFGDIGSEIANDVATDEQGNVYLAGSFTSPTFDLNPGPGLLPVNNVGGADSFLVKLDPEGNLSWAKTFTANQDDAILSVAVVNGRVFAAGHFQGELSPAPGVSLIAQSGENGFLTCFDDQGNHLWSRLVAGQSAGVGQDVLDLTAYFNTIETLVHVVTRYSATSAMVTKFSEAGAIVWTRELPATVSPVTPVRLVAHDDDIQIVGSFAGTVDFDTGPATVELNSSGLSDGFALELTIDGGVSQVFHFQGTNTVSFTDAYMFGGRTVLVGWFRGALDADAHDLGELLLTSQGLADAFVIDAHFSPTHFSFMHAYSLGGAGDDFALAAAPDLLGSTHLILELNGSADLDPGAGQTLVTGDSTGNDFAVTVAMNGQFVRADKLASHSATDSVRYRGIAVDAQANVYAIGQFSGSVNFNPSGSEAVLDGPDDAFITQVSALTVVDLPQNGIFDWATIRFTADWHVEIVDGVSQQVLNRVWLPGLLGIQIHGAANEGDALLVLLPSIDVLPGIPLGIAFAGGAGTGLNQVQFWGGAGYQIDLSVGLDRSASGGVYTSSVFNAIEVSLSQIDSISLNNVSGAYVHTPDNGETELRRVLGISNVEGLQITSGDSGQVAVPVTSFNVRSLTVFGGSHAVKRNALRADGLQFLGLVTNNGMGRTISIHDDNLGLDEADGRIVINSIARNDVLTVRGDGDFTIRQTFLGGAEAFRILDRNGNRLFFSDLERLRVVGGEGPNTINAEFLFGAMPVSIIGLGGDDVLFGSGQPDYIDGGDGNDWLNGQVGPDVLIGGNGRDRLFGGSGNDFLDGGANNDALDGGTGDDILIGGLHHDRLNGGAGLDHLDGQWGQDRILYHGTVNPDTIRMIHLGPNQASIRTLDAQAVLVDAASVILEAQDFVEIFALAGDDVVRIWDAIECDGRVDGGLGNDLIIAPPNWKIVP